MEVFLISLVSSVVLLLILSAVYYCRKKDSTVPVVGDFIRRQYLKARFKIWDDLSASDKLAKTRQFSNPFQRILYRIHKFESAFFYYFALLFRSSHDSFLLLNCDRRAEECKDDDYPKHLAKQKRIAALSMYALFLLIIANISTGLITSFIFPNIFKTRAATTSHTSQSDWESGTADATLDLTTSPGDIILGRSGAGTSLTQTSTADFSTGSSSDYILIDNSLSLKINPLLWEHSVALTDFSGIAPHNPKAIYTTDNHHIIAWTNDGGYVYAQRLDSSGTKSWGVDGESIYSGSVANDANIQMASDNSGGAIIAWEATSNNGDILAQRVQSNGDLGWVSEIGIATTTDVQSGLVSAPGSGGSAFFLWEDGRGGIYAQRVTTSGVAWVENGIQLSASGTGIKAVSDGSGNAIVFWKDGTDYYAQKLNSDGTDGWAGDVLVFSGSYANPTITSDGSGGAFIAINSNDVACDVYVHHLDSSGNLWAGPTQVTNLADCQDKPAIASDGASGVYVAWFDDRSATNDIYAQRIDSSGSIYWAANGLVIFDGGDGNTGSLKMVSAGGAAIISWIATTDIDVYTQKINSDGSTSWLSSGQILNTINQATHYFDSTLIVYDFVYNSNGAFAIWEGNEAGKDLYAQLVSRSNASSSGTFVSSVLDAGAEYNWTTLTATQDTPANTSISYETRTSNSPVDILSATWETVSSGNIQSAGGRYIQYRVSLSSTGTSMPVVSDITLNGEAPYNSSGMYTSAVIDSTYSSALWGNISTTASISSNNSIVIATRSGNTASPDGTWSSWATTTTLSLAGNPNLSLTSTATSSSSYLGVYTADRAVDGIPYTSGNNSTWANGAAASIGSPQWLEVDLPSAQSISYVKASSTNLGIQASPVAYEIQVWNNDTWNTVAASSTNTMAEFSHSFTATTTDKVRLYITQCANNHVAMSTAFDLTLISEFEIYASDPSATSWSGTETDAITSPTARYIQYRAFLSTSNLTQTPTLSAISLDYTLGDVTAPTVQSVSPAANNQDIDISTNLTAVFSEHLATSTITTSSFTLRDSNSGVAGSVSYANQTATFNPTQDLECSHEYFATLTTTITDLAGNPMSANYTWQFMTSCSSNNVNNNSTTQNNTQNTTPDTTTTTNATTTTSTTATDTSTPTTTATTATTTNVDSTISSSAQTTPTQSNPTTVNPSTPATSTSTNSDSQASAEIEQTTASPQKVISLTHELQPGQTNSEVSILKQILVDLSYLPAATETSNLIFDETTVEALKVFQAAHNIPVTGVLGYKTMEALNRAWLELGKSDVEAEPAAINPENETNINPSVTPATSINQSNQVVVPIKVKETGPSNGVLASVAGLLVRFEDSLAQSETATAAAVSLASIYALLVFLQLVTQITSPLQLPYLFINLLGLSAYRRQKKEGIVYDAETGTPVPLVSITIFDKKTGQAKETKVTDKYGAYFFLVPAGEYTLSVNKKGYHLLTSQELEEAKTAYPDPYLNGKVLSFKRDGLIHNSIPLEKATRKNWHKILSNSFVQYFSIAIFLAGFIFSFALALAQPNLVNSIIVALYLVAGALQYANLAMPHWGVVRNTGGTKEPFAVAEALNLSNQELWGRTVTDEHGRYAFILNKGKYALRVRSASGKAIEKKIAVKKRSIFGKNLKVS